MKNKIPLLLIPIIIGCSHVKPKETQTAADLNDPPQSERPKAANPTTVQDTAKANSAQTETHSKSKYEPCSMIAHNTIWMGRYFHQYTDKDGNPTTLKHIAFWAPMEIDADGAPNAYNPSNTGIDYLQNAGGPGNWYGIITDNGKENGNPIIQGPGDPFPGYYVSGTKLQDSNFKPRDPKRYVDSRKIPYIALPKYVMTKYNINVGDIGYALFDDMDKTGRHGECYFIVADVGPPGKLGEGSIYLADQLHFNKKKTSPKNGGTTETIFYLVFPGSGDGTPKTIQQIDSIGTSLNAEYEEIRVAESSCNQKPIILQAK